MWRSATAVLGFDYTAAAENVGREVDEGSGRGARFGQRVGEEVRIARLQAPEVVTAMCVRPQVEKEKAMKKVLVIVGLAVLALLISLFAAACGNSAVTTTVSPPTSATGSSDTTTSASTATSATETTTSPSTGTSTAGPATGEPIKVGLLSSMTGTAAAGGSDIANGAKAMADLINSEGGINGRPLQLVLDDDQSDVQAMTAIIQKFAADKSIFGIIGPFFNPITPAARGVAEAQQVPGVIGSPASLELIAADKTSPSKWTVFSDPSVNVTGDAIVKELKFAGLKNVVALSDVMTSNQEPVDIAVGLAKEQGITITKLPDTFAPDQSDFQPIVNKFMETYNTLKPDGILLMGTPVNTPVLYKQLRDRGVTVPMFGSAIADNPATIAIGGAEGVEGLYVLDTGGGAVAQSMPDDWAVKALQLKFSDAYTKQFNVPVNSLAADGASYVNVMAAALEVGGTDREKVRAALRNLTNLQTTVGLVTLSEQNPNEGIQIGQMVLLQVKGGKFEFVTVLK
jgi:branched-chain amino acid transport system substrate-binding protein